MNNYLRKTVLLFSKDASQFLMGRRKLSDKSNDKIARLAYIISNDQNEFDILDEKGKEIQKYKNIKIPKNIKGTNQIEYIIRKVKETINPDESTNLDLNVLDFSILTEEKDEIGNNSNELISFIY